MFSEHNSVIDLDELKEFVGRYAGGPAYPGFGSMGSEDVLENLDFDTLLHIDDGVY